MEGCESGSGDVVNKFYFIVFQENNIYNENKFAVRGGIRE